jgi:hypothetical protein
MPYTPSQKAEETGGGEAWAYWSKVLSPPQQQQQQKQQQQQQQQGHRPSGE